MSLPQAKAKAQAKGLVAAVAIKQAKDQEAAVAEASKKAEAAAAAEAEALDERRQREAVESECRLELQASQDAVAELRRKVAELTRKLEAERARRRGATANWRGPLDTV